MITFPASLDAPRATLETVTRWLAAHRRRPGSRPVQRAATVRTQALLVLRWFKDATKLRILALDADISIVVVLRVRPVPGPAGVAVTVIGAILTGQTFA